MYYIENVKNEIADLINKLSGAGVVKAGDFTLPPDDELGDIALPCFKIAKHAGKSPVDAAAGLAKMFAPSDIIEKCIVAGPYLNFKLNCALLAKNVLAEIKTLQADYGKNGHGAGRKVMVEFSNANTHKEYHVGHLRNLCYGDAVTRILAANGYEAIPVSYINDFGIHVAKTIWCLKKYYKETDAGVNKGYFLGKIYARSVSELAHENAAREEVSEIMKNVESRKGTDHELWQKTRQWSIEQFSNIYSELSIAFDRIFYESEFIDEGRELAGKLLEKGVLKRSAGAIIADFENENLGILVIMRSDGTTLYPVADLSLAIRKIEDFNLDSSIYVVDMRQSLYFNQLFCLLKRLGYAQTMKHLAHEFVKLPSGMMSSRSGNVITYEELKTELVNHVVSETSKRHPDWSSDKIKEVTELLVQAAIKFEMLKVGASSIITFDIASAIKFDGFTAAYLQYTHVRLASILRKAKDALKRMDESASCAFLNDPKECQVILKLALFPEIVQKAGDKFDPSEIAKYLFELSQLLNDYYHSVPVLKAEDEVALARLALLESACRTLLNGLALLGIRAPEEM